jgi:hypothetical protein
MYIFQPPYIYISSNFNILYSFNFKTLVSVELELVLGILKEVSILA